MMGFPGGLTESLIPEDMKRDLAETKETMQTISLTLFRVEKLLTQQVKLLKQVTEQQ